MALISEKDADLLRKEFDSRLADPVKLVVFTQERECEYCGETRQIAEELAALSDKITAQVYDLVADKATAEAFGVDKIPAIVPLRVQAGGERDYGIRFFGIPSGYEFMSVVEDIFDISNGATSLKPKTKEALAKIAEPVHIQVFVTPT
jgi:glutaredoxin-like protein